jgi:hypothetical protein
LVHIGAHLDEEPYQLGITALYSIKEYGYLVSWDVSPDVDGSFDFGRIEGLQISLQSLKAVLLLDSPGESAEGEGTLYLCDVL